MGERSAFSDSNNQWMPIYTDKILMVTIKGIANENFIMWIIFYLIGLQKALVRLYTDN